MSIWSSIAEAAQRLNPLSGPADPLASTTFTIGVIALAAKLAKVDGRVTRGEVATFRTIFRVDPADEPRVAQVYDYFRQEAGNYEHYARQLRRLLGDADVRRDVLDALFAIAMADGGLHEAEEAFLRRCAEIFEIGGDAFEGLLARWVPGRWSPWEVLGLAPGAAPGEVRARYRELVRLSHPDALAARGVPPEMMALATRRLADLNRAYEELGRGRAPAEAG